MHRVGGAKLPIYQFQFEAINGLLQNKTIGPKQNKFPTSNRVWIFYRYNLIIKESIKDPVTEIYFA